jgi:protein CpxP
MRLVVREGCRGSEHKWEIIMRITLRHIVVASAILASGGLPASAAPNDPAPATGPATPAAPAGARPMEKRVETRISELHAKLHITAAQQPQWDAFATVMRDNAQHMDATLVNDAGGLSKMTAVDQMKSYAAITDQHAKDMATLLPAFQALYDSMTPEQKTNADSYFRAQAERNRHGKKA